MLYRSKAYRIYIMVVVVGISTDVDRDSYHRSYFNCRGYRGDKNKMKLTPLNDVLIIDPDPIYKHSETILSPQKSSEKISHYATIISFGNKCEENWKVGDRIMIDRFRDTPSYVQLNGNKYRMIKEHYIHAKVEL